VKMRAGWNEREVNAPDLARRVEDAGAAAVAVHGRTAAQAYRGLADWDLIARVAEAVKIPVFGCGDLVEAEQILDRLRHTPVAGVLVGRGILRNPWLLAQAAELMAGRPPRNITPQERGRFLLEYIDLLVAEGPGGEWPAATRGLKTPGYDDTHSWSPGSCDDTHSWSPGSCDDTHSWSPWSEDIRSWSPGSLNPGKAAEYARTSHERWVVNKLRALCGYFTKGFEGGAHLRVAVNQAPSVAALRALIDEFFAVAA
jgi:tRNA-dihydrouridine synthase B